MNTRRQSRAATAPGALACLPALSRRDQLQLELLTTVDSLRQRRADLVREDFIEDYVALEWLEWNGGSLRLTVTGSNVCDQMRTRSN